MTNNDKDAAAPRRHWMGVLAAAVPEALERAWESLGERPDYSLLREPQTGLVLVRARMGGDGARFNLGEMTMTRCAVTVGDGSGGEAVMGLGYVAGRQARKAELAAVFDALLQDPARRRELMERVIAPLAAAQRARRAARAASAEPTRVEFFTMVRGEDA